MPKTIQGFKINLRTLKITDALSIYKHAKDREISRFTYLPYPYKINHAKEFIKKTWRSIKQKNAYEFGIENPETKQIIGMIGFTNIDIKNKNAELGYWVGKKYWGSGLAKEALELMLNFSFKRKVDAIHELPLLVRIYARVMHPNIPSQNLLKKFGFKFEGRFRKHIYRNRTWLDELRYSILKEEFK